MPERSARDRPSSRWDAYLGSYIKLMMLVGFVGLILVLAGLLVRARPDQRLARHPVEAYPRIAPCFVLFLCVMTRISLAFPAAALGGEDILGRSWRATRGNVGRLIAAGFLTLLPIAVITILAFFLPSKLDNAGIVGTDTKAGLLVAAMLLVFSLLKAVSTLIVAAEVSFTYQMLHPRMAATKEVESD